MARRNRLLLSILALLPWEERPREASAPSGIGIWTYPFSAWGR